MKRAEAVLVPLGAMVAGLLVFGVFCAALGVNPALVYASIYKAGFGSWYSWQNTLVRASPLLLCGLCTAIPARAGMIVIGNEGAVVVGGLGAIAGGLATLSLPPLLSLICMVLLRRILRWPLDRRQCGIAALSWRQCGYQWLVAELPRHRAHESTD